MRPSSLLIYNKKISRTKVREIIIYFDLLNYSRVEKCLMVRTI